MSQFPINSIGKIFIILGAVLIAAGILFLIFGKIPFLGKLPGDISIKGKNISVYVPIVSCIIISVLLTLILNLFLRR